MLSSLHCFPRPIFAILLSLHFQIVVMLFNYCVKCNQGRAKPRKCRVAQPWILEPQGSYIPKDYRLENITLINHQLCNTFMLKHWSNYAAVLTNYVSFLHQKFSDSPKDKESKLNNIGTLHINICWRRCPQHIQNASWFLVSLLLINISAFEFRAFRRCNTSWWTWCHWYSSCTHVIRNFFRENLY